MVASSTEADNAEVAGLHFSITFFLFFFRMKCDFLKEDKHTATGQATFPAGKSNEAKNGSDDTIGSVTREVVLEGINSLKK